MDLPSQGFDTRRLRVVACRTCSGLPTVAGLAVTSQIIQRAPRGSACMRGHLGSAPSCLAMASHGAHALLRHEETSSRVRNQFRACETRYETTAEGFSLGSLVDRTEVLAAHFEAKRRNRALGRAPYCTSLLCVDARRWCHL